MSDALFVRTSGGKYAKQGQWQLHMFVSQPPCGDACIFAGDAAPAPEQQHARGAAQHTEWHRTGAKRLKATSDGACKQGLDGAANSSCREAGAPAVADREGDQQVAGVLRRKPGRGDPTLSLSCRYGRSTVLSLGSALASACMPGCASNNTQKTSDCWEAQGMPADLLHCSREGDLEKQALWQ